MFKLFEILLQETSDYNQIILLSLSLTVRITLNLGATRHFSLLTSKWTKPFQCLSLSKALWHYHSPLTAQFEHLNQGKKIEVIFKIWGVLTFPVFASSEALGFKIFSVNIRF